MFDLRNGEPKSAVLQCRDDPWRDWSKPRSFVEGNEAFSSLPTGRLCIAVKQISQSNTETPYALGIEATFAAILVGSKQRKYKYKY